MPARWRRMLHGWPGLRVKDLITLAVRTANGGHDERTGWPSVHRMSYAGWETGQTAVRHPHDDGVYLGGYDAAFAHGYDAVVSLCRMGSAALGDEQVEFRLIDDGPTGNPNLDFVVDDAARTIAALRAEAKTVLLQCGEGRSRTPSVAARYSMLLGRRSAGRAEAMHRSNPSPELWRAAVGDSRR